MLDWIARTLGGKLFRDQLDQRRAALDRAKADGVDLPAREARAVRDALGAGFSGEPLGAAAVQACPKSKAERRAERLRLVSGARAEGGSPEVREAAERLAREMDDVERARLADHVYLSPMDTTLPPDLRRLRAPEGFQPATPEELAGLGLTPNDLENPPSHMKLAVYRYDEAVWGPAYRGRFSIVARGTTLDEQDWVENFRNGILIESSYYRRATSIGEKIAQSGQAGRVDAVGHSLGGGLAQAISAGSGGRIPATIFNAAGVKQFVLRRYVPTARLDDTRITAYRVRGEALTHKQEHSLLSPLMANAHGINHDLVPHDPALRGDHLTDEQRTTLHGMDGTIAAMEDSKKRDEWLLSHPPPPADRPGRLA